jgi:hypothetical protein
MSPLLSLIVSQKALVHIIVAILRNLENKLLAGNIRKLLMELMLRKFRLPKIKNCLLEEYNQKALLGVSLFCFGSDASV